MTNVREHTIDAKGKRLGRVATEAATVLLGKDTPEVTRHIPAEVTVKVVNARLLDIPEKKAAQKEYQRYSGYPGGLKREPLGHLANRRGYAEIVRHAVSGMLPKNKIHSVRMKNLVITE